MKTALGKIIKASLCLLIFLLPLFWLPFSFEIYEINKQYLLFFLTSFSFLAWLTKIVLVDKEINLRRSSLNVPVLLFLLAAIMSAIFSIEENSSLSLSGSYGRFSNGLIGLLSFSLFYFLFTNNVEVETKKNTQNLIPLILLLKIFLWSCLFVILISYFSLFGFWEKLSVKFPPILQRTFNPVSASLEGLAVFISIVTVLLVGLILCLQSRFKKSHLWILLVAGLGLLIIIDFNPAWVILILSLGSFLALSLKRRIFREDVNQLLLPIFLIFISITFLFVESRNLIGAGNQEGSFALPQEAILEQRISWEIALGTIKESLKNVFFGSGIGTWFYDFSKQKPVDFNTSSLWYIRFDRAGNHISEILATMGILGILSYLLLIRTFFLAFWSSQQKTESLPYVGAFLAVLVSQFVYHQGTVLAFLFWFILASTIISWQPPVTSRQRVKIPLSFKKFPELNLIPSILLILLSIFVLQSYYFTAKFYLADVNYTKAQTAPLLEDSVGFLERAVELNPQLATYRIILAQAYLLQVGEEFEKPSTEQDIEKIQNWTQRAIDETEKATEISPNNVVTWEILGSLYRDIQFLVGGASDKAIEYFQKAIELENKNPVLYIELGRLYLTVEDIQKAKESFIRAKELKPDHIEALIEDVLIHEKENDLDGALYKLEELVEIYPFNTEIKFHLGRFYFNKGKVDEAIFQLEEVIKINPNHSNSLYSLGLIYAGMGEKEKAIAAFERVLQLNPGNAEVIQKLEELKVEK